MSCTLTGADVMATGPSGGRLFLSFESAALAGPSTDQSPMARTAAAIATRAQGGRWREKVVVMAVGSVRLRGLRGSGGGVGVPAAAGGGDERDAGRDQAAAQLDGAALVGERQGLRRHHVEVAERAGAVLRQRRLLGL